MSERMYHKFGIVDDEDDFFEFRFEDDSVGECYLERIVQTERGPRRTVIASIPKQIWKEVNARAIRELAAGMGDAERSERVPTITSGINRMSHLLGRELAVLLWALMEDGAERNLEAILNGWRELAREERWWLFTKAAGPGQHIGAGWRRALFHALAVASDSRSGPTPAASDKKKSHGDASVASRPPASTQRTKLDWTESDLKKKKHRPKPNPPLLPPAKQREKGPEAPRKVKTNN